MRIFASSMVLTKASRYFSLLAPMDLLTCPGRLCTLLSSMLRGGPTQIDLPAVEA
jgi:hypothetical protein